MPGSLTIGAFVFGAVLLLLALVGGNFKMFGAEVSSTVGKSIRILSFALGVGFVAFALLAGNIDIPPRPTPALPDVSGRWFDNHGGVFNIRQTGSRLTFDGNNPGAGVSSEGTGRIDGNTLTYAFSTSIPSEGTARFRLASDHNSASGVVQDSVEGTYSSLLTREP
jgi:hypothetical protein